MAYLDSPQTDATSVEHAVAIDDMSMEMSFHSPKKLQNDLLSQMRSTGHTHLKTPSSRHILTEQSNVHANRQPAEFTPLLKSHAKKAVFRGKENAFLPQTPAFLRANQMKDSPELRPPETSGVFHSDTESDAETQTGQNSIPIVASSSAQSTPLAVLPHASGDRMLDDQRNLMTLREQENIINKTEKENFGLKLKIHYLEGLLNKSDPNLNQTALRENTDLRVDRATLQRDLAKVKKQLASSARDAEDLKQQLLENKARSEKAMVNKQLQDELSRLHATLQAQDKEIRTLQDALGATDKSQDVEELRDTVEDLEAELREKERLIEAHRDKDEACLLHAERIDELEEEIREATNQENDCAELQRTVSELERQLQTLEGKLQEAIDGRVQAMDGRDDAQQRLKRVEEMMAMTSSDFEKQRIELQSRAQKAEDTLASVRRSYEDVRKLLDERSREITDLKESRAQPSTQESELLKQNSILHQRNEELLQARSASERRTKDTVTQLEARTAEKTLLQTRHDALTLESENLQRELKESRLYVARLHDDIEQEKEHCAEGERALRSEREIGKTNSSTEIARLQTLLESERSYFKSQSSSWTAATKQLQSQKEGLELEVHGLKTRATSVEDAAHVHTKEWAAQRKAADADTQKHHNERVDLLRRISRLESELADKVCALDEIRSRLLKAEDQMAGNERQKNTAKEKLQALEDEVEVLQSALEEGSDQAQAEIAKHRQEAENERLQLLSYEREVARMDASREAAQSEVRMLKRDLEAEGKCREQLTHQLSEMKNRILHLEEVRAGTRKTDPETVLEHNNDVQDRQRQPSNLESTHRNTGLKTHRKDPEFERLDGKESDQMKMSYSRLEQKLQALQGECSGHQTARKESEKTIRELETRARDLEKDLRFFQASKAAEGLETNERRDLHETIKSAKLEAEDLQCKMKGSEMRIASCLKREHSLRSQIKQLRVERDEHHHKSTALVAELDALQGRYEGKLDEVIAQQRRFEEERRAMAKQARVSDAQALVGHNGIRTETSRRGVADENKKHAAETRELTKQIEFMKARFRREQNFRNALAYEKSFLLMQIDMFQACNTADIRLLEDMGVKPQRCAPKKAPSMRVVVCMIVATLRLRRMQHSWAAKSSVQARTAIKGQRLKGSKRHS